MYVTDRSTYYLTQLSVREGENRNGPGCTMCVYLSICDIFYHLLSQKRLFQLNKLLGYYLVWDEN